MNIVTIIVPHFSKNNSKPEILVPACNNIINIDRFIDYPQRTFPPLTVSHTHSQFHPY